MSTDTLRNVYRRVGNILVPTSERNSCLQGFAALRIGVALVLLVQAMFITQHFHELFTSAGYIKENINGFFLSNSVPTFFEWWTIQKLVPDSVMLNRIIFAVYGMSLVVLLSGWRAQLVAAVTWITHLYLTLHQGFLSAYGVDTFSNIFLFYLMFFPSCQKSENEVSQSTKRWLIGGMAMMRFHLAFAYFSSGIVKASGEQWQNGEVIWRALMLPQFSVFNFEWLAYFPEILLAIAWSTLFLEIGYPFLVFNKRTRLAALAGIISMHLGIALVMGLWSFSALMIAVNFALFVLPMKSEIFEILRKMPRRNPGHLATHRPKWSSLLFLYCSSSHRPV